MNTAKKNTTPMRADTSPVPMKQVDSSQIHSIGHDPATNTLHLYFPKKEKGEVVGVGSHYSYPNFPAEKYYRFLEAESKGVFFGAEIKNKEEHPHTRHDQVPAEE